MRKYEQCIFCDRVDIEATDQGSHEIYYCRCRNCGDYKITYEAKEDLPYDLERKLKDKRHLISGYLREMTELKLPTELITNENIADFYDNPKIPKTIAEKLHKVILYMYRNTEYLFQEIEIDNLQPAIGYAKSGVELSNLMDALRGLRYVDIYTMGAKYILTLPGIEKAEELEKEVIDSNTCFVAMWFSDEMMDIYRNHIKKAVEEAGYEPLIISEKEHNDDICDQIIAEIRKSKFIIADFTGHRGGVYFEAGFAYGLGLPVIWTSKKDWLDEIHFDVNHYNFIDWTDGKDLHERLKNRILATIPVN